MFQSNRAHWVSLAITGEAYVTYAKDENDKNEFSYTCLWETTHLVPFEVKGAKRGDLLLITLKGNDAVLTNLIMDTSGLVSKIVYFRDESDQIRTCQAELQDWDKGGFTRRFTWNASNSVVLGFADKGTESDIIDELLQVNMWHNPDQAIKAYLIASNLDKLI